MKKSELRKIIKEEIKRSLNLNEGITPKAKGKLHMALMDYRKEGGTKEQVTSMLDVVFSKSTQDFLKSKQGKEAYGNEKSNNQIKTYAGSKNTSFYDKGKAIVDKFGI